ncbi:MAG: phosphate signaling complex protein PhoU [Nitrincola lacisaponensis]|uniref:phosphate signaling complex protein PhoU n=1 Tax=Nitrincola lacisaponensis TaxID=267850 RepID=UPI00391C002E
MEPGKDSFSKHISNQFNIELEQIRTQMLSMGGIVERQVSDSIEALMNGDIELAEQARQSDKTANQMEIDIDQQCTKIIALRQPAASDLRLIISISRAASDLERIGDESGRISKHAIEIANSGINARFGYQEVRHIGMIVTEMVRDVLNAFSRGDLEMAYKVAKRDREVDQEYRSATRSLVTYMMEDPRSISVILNVMWILRSLERIGDHARSIAIHLIYQVSGEDVRHKSLREIKEAVHDSSPEEDLDNYQSE